MLARLPHDLYQLPEYLKLSGDYEDGTPVAFLAEDNASACLIPMLIRQIPGAGGASSGWADATSPYGYPGILFQGEPEDLDRSLAAFRETALGLGLVSVFIRMHPLFPALPAVLRRHGNLIHHGRTVRIDTNRPIGEIYKGLRENHRRGVHKLLDLGFTTSVNDWSLLPEFERLYRETMTGLHASEFYFFPNWYFTRLRAVPEARIHLLSVLSKDGHVASAGLLSEVNGIMQNLFVATSEEYRPSGASKLWYYGACELAAKNGVGTFHLGGGVGGRADSLFHFKAGFSSACCEFFTFRMVLDSAKYSHLCRKCRNCGDSGHCEDYFPAYRGCVTPPAAGPGTWAVPPADFTSEVSR